MLLTCDSRKETIMTKKIAMNLNTLSLMASSYFYFIKARFFAGLFRRTLAPSPSGT